MIIIKVKYQDNSIKKTKVFLARNIYLAHQKAKDYAKCNKLLLKQIIPISFNISDNAEEMEMLFWQLGFFYESGVDILDSIDSMIENAKSIKTIGLLNDMRECLLDGAPLSSALNKNQHICSSFICKLFEIGEKSASLDEICKICSNDIKHKSEFKNSLKKALSYPFIVLIAVISVFVVVSIFVMPEFISIYSDFKIELPIITRVLINTNIFFNNYYYEILIYLGLLLLFLRFIFSKRSIIDKVYLHIPVINKIIIYYEIYKYFLGLNIFLKSNISFNESVKTCNSLINNTSLQKDFSKINTFIANGYSLSFSLTKLSTNIHNISLIKSGEKSGNLDNALFINSQFYKKKYDNLLDSINVVAEPICIVIMGIFVAMICFGVIVPIWNLVDILD